jgi:hypothetical protein
MSQFIGPGDAGLKHRNRVQIHENMVFIGKKEKNDNK